MAHPVILAVDDEPEVLNAIERDLRAHFSRTYRVMKAASGVQAIETVRELKKRGTPVALLLADSTNVDRPGYTPSEREVRPALDEVFTRAEGSVFLSSWPARCVPLSIGPATSCGNRPTYSA